MRYLILFGLVFKKKHLPVFSIIDSLKKKVCASIAEIPVLSPVFSLLIPVCRPNPQKKRPCGPSSFVLHQR